MQILYDLVHNLAKEEKRLYYMHRRDTRFQRIYEAYQKAPQYEKTLDQDIYAQHFSDVSRAFYSMQKRALMDDILAVLLEYSNNQHPGYQFHRLYARAMVLLERRLGIAAHTYLDEAIEVTQDNPADAARLSMALQAKQLALEFTTGARATEFETTLEAEAAAHQAQQPAHQLRSLRVMLTLLQMNADAAEDSLVQEKAQRYYQQLTQIKLPPDRFDLRLELLTAQEVYYQISGRVDEYHRMLMDLYTPLSKDPQQAPGPDPLANFYLLQARVLGSAVRAGDFLLLTSLIYKLSKEIDGLPPYILKAFKPVYLEYAALFNFYENDLPTALKLISEVISIKDADEAQLTRCIYYRLAMLLAAHLPAQAQDEIRYYQLRLPRLEEQPLLKLIHFMLSIDTHSSKEDMVYEVNRYRASYRKQPGQKQIADGLSLLGQHLEGRKPRIRPIHVLPDHWEEILRVDLWLRAKTETRFYYNLLLENWQQRRRVF